MSKRYMSFVGTFNEVDPTPLIPDRDVEDEIDDGVTDYYAGLTSGYRRLLFQRIEQERWIIREQAFKDSLTVTVYDDPQAQEGWGVIVADCPDGNWIEVVRANLLSFVGGAAVPPGCEVRILNHIR